MGFGRAGTGMGSGDGYARGRTGARARHGHGHGQEDQGTQAGGATGEYGCPLFGAWIWMLPPVSLPETV